MSLSYKFDPEKVNYFASTNSRGKKVAFGIKAKDRLQHVYVIGKTGMGKSTMLENMAIQDILEDEGLCFIDPHGSSAERLLKYIPKHRVKDTLYFAPFDSEYPVAFNVMEDVGFENRHLVVSSLMSAFKRIWTDAWSARMEYILQNTLLALLEYPNTTLLDINRMLTNPEFRRDVVANVTDPIVKRFWAEEFANYSDRYAAEATPAIQNKIGQFISNPLIRNIVGQSRSSFDLREFMDERKILIVNLSKGKLGELNADLLGSLLTTKLYLESMSRADRELETLPPFYTYVDEFQSVVNDSFADILSEARKYRLALILAHQYIEQLNDNVRAAVFGNVGTTISFRVGPKDAEVLETLFAPTFKAQDISSLGFAEIYLSLLIDSTASPPFSARTLPPIEDAPYDFSQEIIEESRRQFARARAGVEEFIAEIDKKRGAANLDKVKEKLARSEDGKILSAQDKKSTNTQESKQKESSRKVNGNNSQSAKSPAEILKKEVLKEPKGFDGPEDVKRQQEKQDASLKDLIDSTLEKNKVLKDPLKEVKKDKSASKESVFERAARILESLKKKSPSGAKGGAVAELGPKSKAEPADSVQAEQKDDVGRLESQSESKDTQTNENQKTSEKEQVLNSSKLQERQEFQNEKKQKDEKLQEKLEGVLNSANTLSDDELREILESLLYEDIDKKKS